MKVSLSGAQEEEEEEEGAEGRAAPKAPEADIHQDARRRLRHDPRGRLHGHGDD